MFFEDSSSLKNVVNDSESESDVTNKTSDRHYIEKYLPTCINDLICDKYVIKCFIDWLEIFEAEKKKNKKINVSNTKKSNTIQKKNKKSLLLTGNHGVGKTCIAKTILKQLGYTIRTINFNDLKTNKNISDVVEVLIGKHDIVYMMSKGNSDAMCEKIVILIDELESISSSIEKNCINTILSINKYKYVCPIVLISNNKHYKFTSDIKKVSYELKISDPTCTDMMLLLKKVSYYKQIKIKSKEVADKIIEYSQKDLKRLCTILEDIKNNYGNKCLTFEMFGQYVNNSCEKISDIDLFTSARFLLTQYENIDRCMRLYEIEKVLLPLTIHQNYIKLLLNSYDVNTNHYINTISDAFSTGDIIENYIYGEQNWDLQEVHGYYTCILPSYIMSNNTSKKYMQLDFSSDLNKTSIKNINKKNIINASKCFSKMNVYDYININKILVHLISTEQTQKIINVVKSYHPSLDDIESILKIDKMKTYKIQLTTKQKKELKNILT